MSEFKPLKYREVTKILKNLGFKKETAESTSHQTWVLKRNETFYAVTLAFHRSNLEFKRGTLGSIIRQSGFTKKEFYQALKKKRKQ